MPQAPYCLAMIVCDSVHQDTATQKFNLLGTFSTLGARQFPARHPSMAVFVNLTDGRGKTELKLRVIDVNEEQDPLTEVNIGVEFSDPRAVIEFAGILQNVVFPEPGEYRIQMFAGDEPLMERRIVLSEVPS